MKSKRNKFQTKIMGFLRNDEKEVSDVKPAATTGSKYVEEQEKPLSSFLHTEEIKTRQCVYISREVHLEISRIVRLLAENGTSIGGYVDNVLKEHLRLHRNEIKVCMNEAFNRANFN